MKDTIEIEVPSSLDSVTLKQYQSFQKIVDLSGEDVDELFIKKHMVSIFCKLPIKQVESIPFSQFDEAVEILSETFSNSPTDLIKKFTVDGIEYGFEPNIENICTGAYIDASSSLEWEDYHVAVASLYRPIAFNRSVNSIEQYAIVDYEPSLEKAEAMKSAPLDACISAKVFFWNLAKDLQKASLTYLEQVATKEMSQKEKEDFKNKMDGITQFTHLQEEYSRTLTKLSVNQYLQH